MNTSSKFVSSWFRLTFALALLGWMAFAGGTTLSLLSPRGTAAATHSSPNATSDNGISVAFPTRRVENSPARFSNLKASTAAIPAFSPQGRLLRVQPSGAIPGSTLVLPIDFYAQGDEDSIQFSLRFDSGLFRAVSAELGQDAEGALLDLDYSRSADGLIGVTIDLLDERSLNAGNNRLLNLTFNVTAGRGRQSTAVEFADQPVRRAVRDDSSQELLTSFSSASVLVAAAIEGDVAPRPNGSDDGALTIGDWIQEGRFYAKLDQVGNGSEFQRADCAPRSSSGNGALTLADWVQAGRFAEGLDAPQPAAGPTSPTAFTEGTTSLTSGTADESQFRVVRLLDTTFTRGQDNNAGLEADFLGTENAVSFSINYNPAHMTFVRAALGTGVPGTAGAVLNINTSQLGLGRVGFALALRGGMTFGAAGTKQLLVLTFTVPLNGNQNTTLVTFGDEPIGRGVVDTNADSLTSTFNQGTINFTPTVNAIPTLTSISPSFVIVGGPTFTLIVNGTDFVNGASVQVNGLDRATQFVNSMEMQAFMPASDIAEAVQLSVTVRNPPPGGGTSLALILSVNNPVPTVNAATPSVIGVNSGSQAITVTGFNFVQGALVRWNGVNRATTFVNSGQLVATILATDVNTVQTATVTVLNPSPGGGLSNGVSVSVIVASAIPRITALDPPEWATQGGAFVLRVLGTSFAQNAIVRWAGDPRPTTFISTNEVRVQIFANDVAVEITVLISVVNPPPGGGNSNNFPFVVSGVPNPTPILSSINPNTVTSGGPDFTMTLIGNNFLANSVVRINGEARQTVFVSSTQLHAQIFAADIDTGGTAEITVFSPLPGGGSSAALTLTINLGTPVIAFLSPNSALVGGAGFNVSVIGSSFTQNSVVQWNGSPRATTPVNGTELTAAILASDIAAVGTAQVTVFVPPPGGGASNAVPFSIVQAENPLPRINSINPTQTIAGGPAFTLTVNGTGFFQGSLVRWNGSPRQTTFVNVGQVLAQITAADITSVGTAQITVFNSTPGGGSSNAVSFVVVSQSGNPPVITNITPSVVNAGGQGFTLAVEGSFFTPTSVVQFNSDSRPTTFISANQLTVQISQEDIQNGGEATINVFNAPPGAGTSNVRILTVLNQAPTITSVSPTNVGQGTSGNTQLTINGFNFVSGVVVRVNGVNKATTRINSTQLTVQLTAADKASLGTLSIVAVNAAPGGGPSNTATVNVVPQNFLPRLISISPDSANAGSPGISLVVTGTNFAQNAVVRFGNRDLQTEFLSSTTLVAQLTSNDLLQGGNVPIRVFNPEPGGGTSGPIFFAINSPVPQINSVTPDPIVGGAAPTIITVNGINFVGASVVHFNGSPRATSFLSTMQLAGTILPTDLVGITSAVITVISPEPGGGVSNAVIVNVTPGVAQPPTITSLNPGAVIVGSGNFTLTVNGTNLFPNSVVQINGSPRATGFINANQLTAQILAADAANVGTAVITVVTPPPGGGISNPFNFGIIAAPPPAPVLTSLSPSSAGVGTPFGVTANGANFAPTSIVLVNGSPRVTMFISGSQLVGQLTAGDVAVVGNLSITVFTPAPGGGTSNALILTINETVNPVPAIVSLNPVSATAGGPAFTLTVNGTLFVGNSVVRFNGVNQPTTFISVNQLTAQIPAGNIVSVGTAAVTVFNPPGGGGLSNSVAFAIVAPGPPPTCNTICLRSAKYYERNTNRLPSGLVIIGGINANAPIPIQGNLGLIKSTLQDGGTPLSDLNREFLAIQISLVAAGSSNVGGLQSAPNCYGIAFPPVLLSNGVLITPSTATGDINSQVRLAIFELRVVDMTPLATILRLLNGEDPTATCNRPIGLPGGILSPNSDTTIPEGRGVNGRRIR